MSLLDKCTDMYTQIGRTAGRRPIVFIEITNWSMCTRTGLYFEHDIFHKPEDVVTVGSVVQKVARVPVSHVQPSQTLARSHFPITMALQRTIKG